MRTSNFMPEIRPNPRFRMKEHTKISRIPNDFECFPKTSIPETSIAIPNARAVVVNAPRADMSALYRIVEASYPIAPSFHRMSCAVVPATKSRVTAKRILGFPGPNSGADEKPVGFFNIQHAAQNVEKPNKR